MGLLKRLFSYNIGKQNKKTIKSVASQSVPQNENLSILFKCGDYINSLLISDRYIARSDYSSINVFK